MTDTEPYETIGLNRDGHDAGPDGMGAGGTVPWSRARAALKGMSETTAAFLGTTRPDGRPHAAGVGALWHDGDLYFPSGPGARKTRNLLERPAATLSVASGDMHVVLEGTATRVTDGAALEEVAAVYRAGGWPAEVVDDALTASFMAPSAGPPPWYLFRFTFHTAFGLASAPPVGSSRWRFTREE